MTLVKKYSINNFETNRRLTSLSLSLSLSDSANVYLSKPACPRNISSSRSILSSNVCQSRSNVSPSKPVCPIKLVWKPVCKPVCPSNVTPSKHVRPTNAILSKTARLSKVYSSKLVCSS